MAFVQQEYCVKIFDLFLQQLEERLEDIEICRFYASDQSPPIPYSKLKTFSDEDKKSFIWEMVGVHGVISQPMIFGLQYLKQGGRLQLNVSVTLPFNSKQEREEYAKFHEHVHGVNEGIQKLDALLAS